MSSLNTISVPMFGGLPAGPRRRRAFASSFAVQAAALALLVHIGLIQPSAIMQPHQYVWVSLAPPPPVNHAPQRIPPKLLQRPRVRMAEMREVARLEPPKLHVPAPRPELTEVRPVEAKPAPSFPTVSAEHPAARALPQVKTGGFTTGSSATPTTLADARKVQTGGFGDPNGVPAGNNTSGRVNIAALGSFDLPAGPGYGNGSGGSRGMRAIVASSGFGNGIATGSGLHVGGQGRVRSSGFGDSEPVKPAARRRQPTAPETLPVQILSKPTPSYTAEARAARVEGEVLLEVVFSASGKVRVLRVVSGLGHGLDESAIRAAEQIRYKPAMRGGEAVDFTATLHIVFQMA